MKALLPVRLSLHLGGSTEMKYVNALLATGFAASALLAACAQPSQGALPSGSGSVSGAGALSKILLQAPPPPCTGQKSTKEYAYVSETLSLKGGHLCFPVFGAYGGSAPYAPAKPSVKVTLTTSTTNYDHKLPALGKGAALFYLQIAFGSATSFANQKEGDVTFSGEDITKGDAYTLFGQSVVKGSKKNLKPCYSVATQGQYGGEFNGGSSSLKDSSVPADSTLIGELYPGKQTTTKCS
jgi:hypothetical protein